MSKLTQMPLVIIGYCCDSFAPMAHGHHMRRLPPIKEEVGGNKYDAHPHVSEAAISIIVAYGDEKRATIQSRLRYSQEEFAKAHQYLGERRKMLSDTMMAVDRLAGTEQEKAVAAKPILQKQVDDAEAETERIDLARGELLRQLENWQTQESIKITADEMRDYFFDMCPAGEAERAYRGQIADLEQEMRNIVKLGQPLVITEDPAGLSLDDVEAFLLEQDKTDNKNRVSHIINNLIQGRKASANSGSDLSDVQQTGGVAGGDDSGGQRAPAGVPPVPRTPKKADKRRVLQKNPSGANRGK